MDPAGVRRHLPGFPLLGLHFGQMFGRRGRRRRFDPADVWAPLPIGRHHADSGPIESDAVVLSVAGLGPGGVADENFVGVRHDGPRLAHQAGI